MKITLIAVGKQEKTFETAVREYEKRLHHYTDFALVETSDDKLEKALEKFDRVFLLDEHGKEYTSVEFAQFIQKQFNMGGKQVAFVIGGAYGFSETVKKKVSGTLSFSKLTFPHQLIRAIFLEQLYRAFTILNNEKYHHE